jgi:hypothetical protein
VVVRSLTLRLSVNEAYLAKEQMFVTRLSGIFSPSRSEMSRIKCDHRIQDLFLTILFALCLEILTLAGVSLPTAGADLKLADWEHNR